MQFFSNADVLKQIRNQGKTKCYSTTVDFNTVIIDGLHIHESFYSLPKFPIFFFF